MSTAMWIVVSFLGVVGLVCLGFFGLLAFGWWQHIREGRKEHRAPKEEAGE